MATTAFDTLNFARRLEEGGVPEKQAEAEALAAVFAEALENQLATKADVVKVEGEAKLIKWMVGLVICGVISLILKVLF